MSAEKNRSGRGHRRVVLLLLFIVFLLAAISAFLAMRLYKRSDPSVAGAWRMRLDLTETACARANLWLRGAALGERVDAADYMPELKVELELLLNADGSWRRSVDPSSLDRAEQAADRALAGALRELLMLRIADAGRRPESEKGAEARFEAALGMSSESYMEAFGPKLLPTLDELETHYGGSGSYRIEGGRIELDAWAHYISDGDMLVIQSDARTEVYARA